MDEHALAADLTRFQLKILPGREPSSTQTDSYNTAYACWRLVWSEAFRELGIGKALHSDPFTRQDLIPALFHGNDCIALSFFRFADSHLPTMRDDSYFANWRDEDLDRLQAQGPRVVVCSNFTVHPDARRSRVGLNLKSILTGISVWTLKSLPCDVMAGAMRRDRNVHTETYRWGATPVAVDRPSGHGDTVDLIAIYQNHLTRFKFPPDASMVNQLWQRREDCRALDLGLKAA